MLERLRLIDGVKEVTLQSSTAGTGAAAAPARARRLPGHDPVFTRQITFDPLPSAAGGAPLTTKTVSDSATSAGSTASQPDNPGVSAR